MTPIRSILALTATLTLGSVACDPDSGPVAGEFKVAGHVKLDEALGTSWIQAAIKADGGDLAKELKACADVLAQTKTVTFGAAENSFEVYLQGSIKEAAANACADLIDAEVGKKSKSSKKAKPGKGSADKRPTPEAMMLGKNLFVVFGGNVTPSPARLQHLLGMDPSPKAQPLWVVATSDVKDGPVAGVQGWADFKDGLDAHVAIRFDGATKASEIYGQAQLGLVALRMSGELGDMASAVNLATKDDTLNIEISATPKQLQTLFEAGKARAKVKHGKHGKHGSGSLHIEVKAQH